MKTCIFILSSLIYVFLFSSFTPVQAQSCNGARVIACGQSIASSNISSGNNYGRNDFSSCYTGTSSFIGNDVLYELLIPKAGITNVTLSGLSADLDLIFFTCNSNRLVCFGNSLRSGTNSESVNINSSVDNITIYILVDGRDRNQLSNFILSIKSENCEEALELNCNDASTLSCNKTYNLSNASADNNITYNDYGSTCMQGIGATNNPFTGNDRLFKIDVDQTANLKINMSGLTKDLDLFLYRDCDGDKLVQCLDRGANSGNTNEEINLASAQGTYYLVVDGFNSEQISNFNLSISCESNNLVCNDAIALACNQTHNLSTIGAENTFVYKDFEGSCTERLGATDNPFDAPDRLFQFTSSQNQDLSVKLSGLSADLDLFLFQNCDNGKLTQCLDRSISFGLADEEILIEDALGTYYLVVDGYKANEQSDFSLTLECEKEQEQQIQKPTICDLGGEFISTNRNLIVNLSTDSSDDAPLTYLADETGCIASSFGGTIPEDYFFDSYVLYLEEENAEEGFGIAINPGDTNDGFFAFLFTCDINESGEVVSQCIDQSEEDDASLFFFPDEGVEASGFYYIVIAGPDGESYDMGVVPDGPCGTNGFTYNNFGGEQIDDVEGLDNDFDRLNDGNADVFSCYTGDNLYTGEDVVYQLVLEKTTTFFFSVSPFQSNEIFGLFLYDYLCGGECLAFGEVSIEEGVVQPATISVTLEPGFYYLVVDKATLGGNTEYSLSSLLTITNTGFTFDNQCSDELGHDMIFSEDFIGTKLGEYVISQNDVFGYYYPKQNDLELAVAFTFGAGNFSNLQKNAATPEDPEKCGFDEGDQIHIKMDDGVSRVYNVRPVLAPKLDGTPSDEVFTVGGESIIDSLIQVDVDAFSVRPNVLDFGGRLPGARKQILVLAFGEWEITGPDWLTFTPSSGNRPRPVRVTLNNNVPTTGGSGTITVRKIDENSLLINRRTVSVNIDNTSIANQPQNRQLLQQKKNISIVPNPAQDHFTVQLYGDDVIKQIELFDSFGKRMKHQPNRWNTTIARFDTEGLASGIYLVKIVLEDRIVTKKVLVNK